MIKLFLNSISQKASGIHRTPNNTTYHNKKSRRPRSQITIRASRFTINIVTASSQQNSSKNQNEVYENFSVVLYSMRPYLEANFRKPILNTFPKSIFTPVNLI